MTDRENQLTAVSPTDPEQPLPLQEYRLELVRTDSATGFYSSVPKDESDFSQRLELLRQRPMDEFMHLHLLREVSAWEKETQEAYLSDEKTRNDPVFRALLVEALLLREPASKIDSTEVKQLQHHSPLIHLRWACLEDREKHREWISVLGANIQHHQSLSPERIRSLPLPDMGTARGTVSFSSLFGPPPPQRLFCPKGPDALSATWQRAVDRLNAIGALREVEMRHTASLSPIALLHRWHLSISASHGRHRFRLQGEQIAYGRGLSLEAARASWAMETVERISAYAQVEKNRLVRIAGGPGLIQASLSQLVRKEKNPLDPNQIALEVPYQDQPLVWMAGAEATDTGEIPALVPAQCVFLFSNFDEPSLFTALGSTGLAAGNTLAEARLSALTEVIERHLDAVTPFDRRQCFTLATNDGFLAALLADYRARGVDLQFQDIGTRLGIPCFRAFVVGQDGTVAQGTGAHLDGPRAVISAMTETPYPYPQSPPSRPGLKGLPQRLAEQMPSLSSGSVETDLGRLEDLVRANGYRIFYAEITRKDLGLPVVRAVVPGMEILADFDCYARLHPEALSNLVELAESQGRPGF